MKCPFISDNSPYPEISFSSGNRVGDLIKFISDTLSHTLQAQSYLSPILDVCSQFQVVFFYF